MEHRGYLRARPIDSSRASYVTSPEAMNQVPEPCLFFQIPPSNFLKKEQPPPPGPHEKSPRKSGAASNMRGATIVLLHTPPTRLVQGRLRGRRGQRWGAPTPPHEMSEKGFGSYGSVGWVSILREGRIFDGRLVTSRASRSSVFPGERGGHCLWCSILGHRVFFNFRGVEGRESEWISKLTTLEFNPLPFGVRSEKGASSKKDAQQTRFSPEHYPFSEPTNYPKNPANPSPKEPPTLVKRIPSQPVLGGVLSNPEFLSSDPFIVRKGNSRGGAFSSWRGVPFVELRSSFSQKGLGKEGGLL